MKNKKSIIIAAFLTMLGVGLSAGSANVNSLMQMDLKKSSATDTVDVTFYTTGDSSNSVVSRKANNRYVVLLPNVSSSSNITPTIGGVKDLITDVDVKHVDDGIGGYTKVIFNTTKPITIKTYTKKTEPLSQAQKDSKALIAKNNTTKPTITPVTKPQTTAEKPAVNKQITNNTTPVNNKVQNQKQASAPKIVPIEAPKPKLQLLPKLKLEKVAPKPEPKPIVKNENVVQKQVETPKVKNSTNDFIHSNYDPKMKFDENGKRMIDLEPRVSHSVVTDNNTVGVKTDPIFDVNEETQLPTQDSATVVDTPSSQEFENKSDFSNWIFLAGGLIFGLGLIYLVFDAIAHKKEKNTSRLNSFFQTSERNKDKRRRREYYDIVNNEDLSWQEKYKLYTEKEERRKPKKISHDATFITDLSGTKKAIISEQNGEAVKTYDKAEKSKTDKFKEAMQAKISQMEHSLAQTPTLNESEISSNEVKSEDNAISSKLSNFRLKSFAKPVSLKETHRSLLDNKKKISRNASYKEGRFVKLKDSPLSITKRQSAATELNAENLIETGNKYLTNNNNGGIKMNKEKENYLLSSLDEYLSILDTEETTTKSPVSLTKSLSQLKTPNSEAMSRSGVTNPISQGARNTLKPTVSPYMNGLIVKSGYNIDSEKGFYMVNMDGTSALVGRINDNVFILKKFDKIIDKPMQVRAEDESIYIVRVGQFKCLVDVSKDKMGTLIEI